MILDLLTIRGHLVRFEHILCFLKIEGSVIPQANVKLPIIPYIIVPRKGTTFYTYTANINLSKRRILLNGFFWFPFSYWSLFKNDKINPLMKNI